VPNPDQLNTDGDALGNVCDPDNDNDGVADGADNCPLNANANQTDNDGDGQGDVCDSDDDNDGVADAGDNCPLTANSNQPDADGDGRGDFCNPISGVAPAGSNVAVQLGPVSVTFSGVSATGTASQVSINPATAGTLPTGYSLGPGLPAYEITTTAQ
jgi:hypothetical protein